MSVQFNPEAKFYRHHSSRYSDAELPWLISSGVEGVRKMTVSLNAPIAVEPKGSSSDDEKVSATESQDVKQARAPMPARLYDVELLFTIARSVDGDSKIEESQSFEVSIDGVSQTQEVVISANDTGVSSVQRVAFPGVSIGDDFVVSISTKSGTPTLCGMRLRRL
jgi:hypothetical protein